MNSQVLSQNTSLTRVALAGFKQALYYLKLSQVYHDMQNAHAARNPGIHLPVSLKCAPKRICPKLTESKCNVKNLKCQNVRRWLDSEDTALKQTASLQGRALLLQPGKMGSR